MATPDFLKLVCLFGRRSLADALDLARRASGAAGLPPPVTWTAPIGTAANPGGFAETAAHLAMAGAKSVSLDYDDGGSLRILMRPEGALEVWLEMPYGGTFGPTLRDLVRASERFARPLLQTDLASRATLRRYGGGGRCLPVAPIAELNHLVVTTDTEVSAAYEEQRAFWTAWWRAEDLGDGRQLLVRAEDADDSLAFLAEVMPSQWEMARAARPRLTRYYALELEPEEEPLFYAAAPRLEPVGYLEPAQAAIYSCYLEDGEHVPGWEIYQIFDHLQHGRLEDGRPAREIRVMFLDREVAARERRPLLDVGARVFYYEESGETAELTE